MSLLTAPTGLILTSSLNSNLSYFVFSYTFVNFLVTTNNIQAKVMSKPAKGYRWFLDEIPCVNDTFVKIFCHWNFFYNSLLLLLHQFLKFFFYLLFTSSFLQLNIFSAYVSLLHVSLALTKIGWLTIVLIDFFCLSCMSHQL